jgi:hypothetical protein
MTSILRQSYLDYLTTKTSKTNGFDTIEIGLVKHKIGEFSSDYGAKIKKGKLLLKLNLEKEIQTLSKNLNDENKQHYQSLQSQLNEIIEN